MSIADAPEEKYWENVDTGMCMHPYGHYKLINRNSVEVTSSVIEDGYFVRTVLLQNGQYSAWVQLEHKEQYGYDLQSDERVSDAEFEAILLKQRAIKEDPDLTVEEVVTALEEETSPEIRNHLAIAAYYAAKVDASFSADEVADLREMLYQETGHVDTTHAPTVTRVLNEVLGTDDTN